jgi:hypothetical protein
MLFIKPGIELLPGSRWMHRLGGNPECPLILAKMDLKSIRVYYLSVNSPSLPRIAV